MPNHVFNRVSVTGKPEDLKEFKTHCFNEDGHFDFNMFLPMPGDLREISTGGRTIEGRHVSRWRTLDDGTPVIISDDEIMELVRLYGAADWYEWATINWGTKWNAYDCEPFEEHTTTSSHSITFTFDTAWSPPFPVYDYLRERFPRLKLVWHWDNEGEECGYL